MIEVFLRQFMSPLIYVLLAAGGIIAILFSDLTDAIFIFIVVLTNAVVGTSRR